MVPGSRQIFSFVGCTYLTFIIFFAFLSVATIISDSDRVPIKAVQGVKSFGHSNLTETQVTGNKGDIGGKFSANVPHKGGVPANVPVRRLGHES